MAFTCLVTVHGIGFQQPPEDGKPGYADNLHALLKKQLGSRLGDDPEGSGPVYVQSSSQGIPAEGLARLSRPLVRDDAEIAHVALVYSALELEHAARFGSAIDAITRAAASFDHYASPAGAARMLTEDLLALLHRSAPSPSLTPRTDVPVGQLPMGLVHKLLLPGNAIKRPSPLTVVIDDIACYVCRNDLRERLRAFVQGALEDLSQRVNRIVLNTHSQGTVVGFDVLTRYPCDKIDLLVTAGSPLRKYVDLFQWGNHTGELGTRVMAGKLRWLNVYDEKDPVADQLRPPVEWRRGEKPPAADAPTLFRVTDPQWCVLDTKDCAVKDVKVDNVDNVSAGGLRAHTYWENEKEFVPLLAENL